MLSCSRRAPLIDRRPFICRAVSSEERDSCFRWMIQACDTPAADYNAFNDDMKRYLFDKMLKEVGKGQSAPISCVDLA